MLPALSVLIELQALDSALDAARKRLADFPAAEKQSSQQVASATAALDAAKTTLNDSNAARKLIETDVAAVDERLARFEPGSATADPLTPVRAWFAAVMRVPVPAPAWSPAVAKDLTTQLTWYPRPPSYWTSNTVRDMVFSNAALTADGDARRGWRVRFDPARARRRTTSPCAAVSRR